MFRADEANDNNKMKKKQRKYVNENIDYASGGDMKTMKSCVRPTLYFFSKRARIKSRGRSVL